MLFLEKGGAIAPLAMLVHTHTRTQTHRHTQMDRHAKRDADDSAAAVCHGAAGVEGTTRREVGSTAGSGLLERVHIWLH